MHLDISSILFWIAVIATVVFVLKTLIPVDMGTEISSDFTSMSDMDSSFNVLTIESISAFFMTFGWISFMSKHYGYSSKLSIALGVIFGIVGMLFFAFIISKVKKMSYSPCADLKTLEGKIAKAYMRFKPKGEAKIEVEYNSKLEILDAINISDATIESFEAVKVVKVENNVIYIDKA